MSLIQSGKIQDEKIEATYINILRYNTSFRYFILSYFATMAGEWFNYIASINCIEKLSPNSNLAISLLVVVRLVPNLFTMFGGMIADSYDKRIALMKLNMISACIAIQFIFVMKVNSLFYLYALTFLQQTFAAMYEPLRNSFIPLLVENDEYLKRATTFTAIVCSTMVSFGAGAGGAFSAWLGVDACFLMDTSSYLVSAMLLYEIGGSWNVEQLNLENDCLKEFIPPKQEDSSLLSTILGTWSKFDIMTKDGIQYMKDSFFGPILFAKATAALVYGASDVLNVSFSKVSGDEARSSVQLGILFSSGGIGCFIGPLIVERFTNMKNLRSLQKAVVYSFALIAVSFLGMGLTDKHFYALCFFAIVRTFGSATMWVNSSLLLQKLSALDMLGRVAAVDYTLATLFEALSAVLAGVLQDTFGLSPRIICYILFCLGIVIFFGWYSFDQSGGGACHVLASPLSKDEKKHNEYESLI